MDNQKYRPVIFSASMVRAILSGNKTQTRRLVALDDKFSEIRSPSLCCINDKIDWGVLAFDNTFDYKFPQIKHIKSPFGYKGDRLWVRESFTLIDNGNLPIYRADGRDAFGDFVEELKPDDPDKLFKWKPSIHMPRNKSRIILEVKDLRVERLQEISNKDALAEGITLEQLPDNLQDQDRAKTWFRGLWQSLYGAKSWESNPWVWAVDFELVRQTWE